MTRFRSQVYTCQVCTKRTSRMLGLIAAVKTPDGGGVIRARVYGFCASHREDILPLFMSEAEALGEATLLSEPPSLLRPEDVPSFNMWVAGEMRDINTQSGARLDLNSPPQRCPHCDGPLMWDAGPHVADAARRPPARAWECSACGAAGVLTPV